MPIRYYILDSNPHSQEVIKDLFSSIEVRAEAVGMTSDLEKARKEIPLLNPDLFFLNPNLSSGQGFRILDWIEDLGSKTIVVSNQKEHAVEAYSYNAIHFLLDPIKEEDFQRAIKKIPISPIDQSKAQNFVLKLSGSRMVIPGAQILRLQSLRNYTNIFFLNGSVELDCHNLGYFEKILKNNGFLRVHHSHIVSLDQVASFQYSASKLILKDGSQIPVSRDKKKEFLNLFGPEK
jgi:two-component system LytT family response regulator